HRVTDELLGPPAQGGQLIGRCVEKPAEQLARALRVEALGKAGRVDQVGEQDRDHLSLFGFDERSGGGAAVGAEARAIGNGEAADSTRPHHGSRICCSRWVPTGSSTPYAGFRSSP